MKRIILCFLILASGISLWAQNTADLKLWYTKPAKQWVEALPIGNGRLGAMVFGDPMKEDIQLNEKVDLVEAVRIALNQVVGAYAIVVISKNHPDMLIAARKSSPLVVGIGVDENTAAMLSNNQATAIGAGGVTIVDGSQLCDSTTAELKGTQLAAYSKIELNLLTDGSSYDISTRKAKLAKTLLSAD